MTATRSNNNQDNRDLRRDEEHQDAEINWNAIDEILAWHVPKETFEFALQDAVGNLEMAFEALRGDALRGTLPAAVVGNVGVVKDYVLHTLVTSDMDLMTHLSAVDRAINIYEELVGAPLQSLSDAHEKGEPRFAESPEFDTLFRGWWGRNHGSSAEVPNPRGAHPM